MICLWYPVCIRQTRLIRYFYNGGLVKQQYAGRPVVALRHIILIFSQSVFVPTSLKYLVLSGTAANSKFIVFGLTPDRGLGPRSTVTTKSTIPKIKQTKYKIDQLYFEHSIFSFHAWNALFYAYFQKYCPSGFHSCYFGWDSCRF